MGTELQVQLLGGFSISLDGETWLAALGKSRQAQRLLQMLSLAPGHRLHRDQVIDGLWPDADLDVAVNNFHQTLYKARRALGSGGAACLALEDGFLTLRSGDGRALVTDVEQFEAAAATIAAVDVADREPQAVQAALALYQGELLPDDRYDEWTILRRESLRQANQRLLLGLARLQEDRQEYPAAMDTLRRLLAGEPSHEEAHRGLMQLYALSGQRQQALHQYQALKDALYRELEIEPSAETVRLYQDIAAGRVSGGSPAAAPVHTARAAHNLPRQLTTLIGREKEIARVQKMVQERPLVTLTGPGGVGKTRLALAAAEGYIRQTRNRGNFVSEIRSAQALAPENGKTHFPDGVWLVELAPLSDPRRVVNSVADVFGLYEEPGRAVQDVLQEYLTDKRLLLVVDNCEHLINACAALFLALLRASPGLKVLAASREPLGLPGEALLPVESLAIPEPGKKMPLAELEQVEAVRLFLDRAQAVLPDFALTSQNAAALVDICRRVDGIPLAIELAASRVGALEVGQIAARLERTFRLLAGADRGVPERQRTLRATIDWSYHLLSEEEKKLLQRLAVFSGGWTLEAAEEVCSDIRVERASAASAVENGCAGEGLAGEDIANLLGQLVHKSMVVTTFTADHWTGDPLPGYAMRYRLLKTIHQYAQDMLAAGGDAACWRDRHLNYFLRLAEAVEPKLRSAEAPNRLYQLHLEQDNLLASLAWALDVSPQAHALAGARLAGALGHYWEWTGYYAGGQPWLEKAEALLDPNNPDHQRIRAKTLYWFGLMIHRQGKRELARPFFEESSQLYRAVDDRLGLAITSQGLAWSYWVSDFEKYRELMDASLQLFQDAGNKWYLGKMYGNIADDLLAYAKDSVQATALHQQGVAFFEEAGDRWSSSCSLISLSWIYIRAENFSKAHEIIEKLEAVRQEQRDKPFLIYNPLHSGMTAYYLKDYSQMEDIFREGLAMAIKRDQPLTIAFALRGLAMALLHLGQIQPAAHYLIKALDQSQALGDAYGVRADLALMAGLVLAAGRARDAAQIFGAYHTSFAIESWQFDLIEQAEFDYNIAALHDLLDEQAFQTAWAEGLAWSLDQALQVARTLIYELAG